MRDSNSIFDIESYIATSEAELDSIAEALDGRLEGVVWSLLEKIGPLWLQSESGGTLVPARATEDSAYVYCSASWSPNDSSSGISRRACVLCRRRRHQMNARPSKASAIALPTTPPAIAPSSNEPDDALTVDLLGPPGLVRFVVNLWMGALPSIVQWCTFNNHDTHFNASKENAAPWAGLWSKSKPIWKRIKNVNVEEMIPVFAYVCVIRRTGCSVE